MASIDWQKVREIFEKCVRLPAVEQEAFLTEVCGNDSLLLSEVKKLLEGDDSAKSEFMEWPEENNSEIEPGPQNQTDFPRTQTADSASQEAVRQIGPYKLLKEIGHGGMGDVWLAQQTEPVSRKVAIKLTKSKLTGRSEIARFEAERQALALMDHPNIAKVFDAGTTEDGIPYYVMEYINGVPLTGYCDKHRLSIRDRLQVFIPACRAIQHAHQKGVIHRDLKPSNILVAEADGFPSPKIIDFGLAKTIDHHRVLTDKTLFTELGKVVGTLQYMSPEQAALNSSDIDSRTDVYSLGIVLYELLTGVTPLDRQTIKDKAILKVLEIIQESDTPRPSFRLSSTGDTITTVSEQRRIEPRKLQSILRGELDWVVMKALEKDRTRRYETPSSFADDIHRFLINEPVEAKPPSRTYKLAKFVSRNRLLVGSAVVVGFLVVAGLIASLIALRESSRATRLAEKNEQQAIDAANSMDELTTEVASELLGKTIQFDYLPDSADPYIHARNSRAILETSFGMYLKRTNASQAEQRKWFDNGISSFRQLEESGDLEFRSILTYATALDNAANEAREAGETERAEQLQQKRISLWTEAKTDNRADNDKVLLELARSYLHFGLLRDSIPNTSKAIELLLQIETPTPESDRLLADCYNNRAQDLRDKPEAETDMLRAIEILERLEATQKLITAYENLALIEKDLNKPELEESYRQKALDLALNSGNATPSQARSAAISYFNVGLNLHREEKLKEALGQYTSAINLLKPLAREDSNIEKESVYIQSFWHRAQALSELGQWSEARDDWQTAVDAAPSNGQFRQFVPYFEAQLLRCQAEEDPIAAANTLDPLSWDIENKADVLMVLASIYSLAAEKAEDETELQRWIGKALATVRWIKDSGRLQEFLAEVKTSDEFAALRANQEFAWLIDAK